MKKVAITVYPRIHMFSLDLSLKNGNMKSGSMGFSLKSSPIRIAVAKSSKRTIKISQKNQNLLEKLEEICAKFQKNQMIDSNFEIKIDAPKYFRNHIGLGLTTQVLGGVLYCLHNLFEIHFDVDYLLKYNVGRVSALGSQLIFNPGWILEKGYKIDKTGEPLHPEFYEYGEFFEKSIEKLRAPNWFAIIAIPELDESLSNKLEDEFWDNIFPDRKKNSLEIIYETFMNLLPAIQESDFERFIQCLRKITAIGTKPCEEAIQSKTTKNALKILRNNYNFASVSSLGPTLYAFSKHNENVPKLKGFDVITINLGEDDETKS